MWNCVSKNVKLMFSHMMSYISCGISEKYMYVYHMDTLYLHTYTLIIYSIQYVRA